jgi:hypothetical protein
MAKLEAVCGDDPDALVMLRKAVVAHPSICIGVMLIISASETVTALPRPTR